MRMHGCSRLWNLWQMDSEADRWTLKLWQATSWDTGRSN